MDLARPLANPLARSKESSKWEGGSKSEPVRPLQGMDKLPRLGYRGIWYLANWVLESQEVLVCPSIRFAQEEILW